jgi:hypothetical protein
MKKYVFLLAIVAAFVVLYSGCGDDNDEKTTETPAATAEGTPEPIQRTESLAALRTYLEEVGLDGLTGELTAPVECAASTAAGANGKFCLLETSLFAPALALVLVADVEDQQDRVWQVRIVLEDGSWRVTETVRFDAE